MGTYEKGPVLFTAGEIIILYTFKCSRRLRTNQPQIISLIIICQKRCPVSAHEGYIFISLYQMAIKKRMRKLEFYHIFKITCRCHRPDFFRDYFRHEMRHNDSVMKHEIMPIPALNISPERE